jgi:hypothetical protein
LPAIVGVGRGGIRPRKRQRQAPGYLAIFLAVAVTLPLLAGLLSLLI